MLGQRLLQWLLALLLYSKPFTDVGNFTIEITPLSLLPLPCSLLPATIPVRPFSEMACCLAVSFLFASLILPFPKRKPVLSHRPWASRPLLLVQVGNYHGNSSFHAMFLSEIEPYTSCPSSSQEEASHSAVALMWPLGLRFCCPLTESGL